LAYTKVAVCRIRAIVIYRIDYTSDPPHQTHLTHAFESIYNDYFNGYALKANKKHKYQQVHRTIPI